jgi:hypothetical protein
VDQSLESVRNAEKAPEPDRWLLAGAVAARLRKNAEGEKTAWEAVALRGDGSRVIRLWRGAEGSERISGSPPKVSGSPVRTKTS